MTEVKRLKSDVMAIIKHWTKAEDIDAKLAANFVLLRVLEDMSAMLNDKCQRQSCAEIVR